MKRILSIIILCFSLLPTKAQESINVEISTKHTSHIIFSTDMTYVDISSKAISAKVVDSSKNILALKAKEPFDYTTTISVLEANGQIHTFYVSYSDNPSGLIHDIRKSNTEDESSLANVGESNQPDESLSAKEKKKKSSQKSNREEGSANAQRSVSSTRKSNAPILEQIAQRPQGIFHIADKKYGMTAMVENVFVYSDITYVCLSVKNGTGISYESTDARFVVETKKRSKRVLDVDRTLYAKSRYGTLIVPAGETVKVVYSFNKVTLTKDQVLKIYLYEQDGARNLVMTLNYKELNNAKAAY